MGKIYKILILFICTSLYAGAPKDWDLFMPGSSVMTKGDFGFKLRNNEAVKQKYHKGPWSDLNSHIRTIKKQPSKNAEFLVGSINVSKNFDSSSKTKFENIYGDKSSLCFFLSMDHQLFRAAGILGIHTGIGFFRAAGYGVRDPNLAAQYSINEKSETHFGFNVFPIELGLSYRARYHESQFVSPYGKALFGYYAFMESREDRNSGIWGKRGANKVLIFIGGLDFNLTTWNKKAQRTFRSEYGIYDVFANFQYKLIQDISKSAGVSFQNSILLAGLMFEY